MSPTHRLAPLALLAMAGCTAMHVHKETGIRFVTFSDWTAPSVTCVETAPGVWQTFAGTSVFGLAAGPAATAGQGAFIGEGLEDGGDTTNVGQAQGIISTNTNVNVNPPGGF